MKGAWATAACLALAASVAGCNGATGVVGAVIDEAGGFGGDGGSTIEPEPGAETFCGDAEPPARLLSDAFAISCAGCHGELGEGGGIEGVGLSLPALQPSDAVAFEDAVRNGVEGEHGSMPSLAAATYDDTSMQADFELLRSVGVDARAAQASPRVVAAPGLVDASAAERALAIDEANAVWNEPGARGSCAGCHGVDPYDLAKVGFMDADIERATLAEGHTTADALAMSRGVRAMRTEFDIEACDPRAPILAPGGAALVGDTAPERDLALIDELERLGIPVRTHVLSVEEARAFVESVVRHRYQIRLPFEFTRWSEDPYHGRGGRALGDWLPVYAQLPVEATQTEWSALVETYRAEPSRENFWALYDAAPTHTQTRSDLVGEGADAASQDLSAMQYRSVLIATHMMRQDSSLPPLRLDEEERVYLQGGRDLRDMDDVRQAQLYDRDVLWSLGGLLREGLTLDGLPGEVSARLPYEEDRDFRIQIQPSAPTYRWLALLHDPALQSTDGGRGNGNFFRGNLLKMLHTGGSFDQPAPADESYVLTERFLSMFIEIGARTAVDLTYPATDEGNLSEWGTWASSQTWIAWSRGEGALVPSWYENLDPDRLEAYRALSAQMLRVTFFLTVDDLVRRGRYREEAEPVAFRAVADQLTALAPEEAEVWQDLYQSAVFHWGQAACDDCD